MYQRFINYLLTGMLSRITRFYRTSLDKMDKEVHYKLTLIIRGKFRLGTIECELCKEALGYQETRGKWQFVEIDDYLGLFDCKCCYPYDITANKYYHNVCAKMLFEKCNKHSTTTMQQSPHNDMFYECYCMVKKTNKTKNASK